MTRDLIVDALADDSTYWECVREENENVLRTDPENREALPALEEYEHWKESQLPVRHRGNFKQIGGEWFIATAKSARPGDSCVVRLKSGEEITCFLYECVEAGLFRGAQIEKCAKAKASAAGGINE